MNYFKSFNKEDVEKCINETPPTNDPAILEAMTEQWTTYTRSAEHISDKRQQFIIWFNGINGILLGGLAGLVRFNDSFVGPGKLSSEDLQTGIAFFGVIISTIAVMRIFVYRRRKQTKYAQIYMIEKHLPFRLYSNEYFLTKQGRVSNYFFRSGTRIEVLFPIAFLVIYLFLAFWLFL